MRINGRKIHFTREDVIGALRSEMIAQGDGDSAFEITDNLEVTMNSAGGIEVKPRTSAAPRVKDLSAKKERRRSVSSQAQSKD